MTVLAKPRQTALGDFGRRVDALNEWAGKIFAWLLVPMMAIVFLDVVLRYVFNRPTVWAWDVNVQLLGAMVLMGGGYALLYKMHVGVDILVERLSPRKRAVLELVLSLFFFLAIGVLLWQAWDAAAYAIRTKEETGSFFNPPIYFLKALSVVGIGLFLLQGIAKFIRDFTMAARGRELS